MYKRFIDPDKNTLRKDPSLTSSSHILNMCSWTKLSTSRSQGYFRSGS